jgi:hypothetical protein
MGGDEELAAVIILQGSFGDFLKEGMSLLLFRSFKNSLPATK